MFRDSPLSLAVAAVVFVVIFAALSAFVKSRNMPVYPATPRTIVADPEFFEDKVVRLKVSGMEQVGGELRYRPATDRPYSVVLRGKIPDPTPEFLICYCEGTEGGVTLLTIR